MTSNPADALLVQHALPGGELRLHLDAPHEVLGGADAVDVVHPGDGVAPEDLHPERGGLGEEGVDHTG